MHGFKEGVRQGRDQTGTRAVEDEFDYQVSRRLREKSFQHAALALGTTSEVLQKLLADAIAEELSVHQLARNIDNYFQLKSPARARVIARSELTDVINDGTLHAIKREGYDRKEWVTNIDGRERPQKGGDFDHRSANGQVVGINEPFIVSSEPALHPGADSLSAGNRCNCRCRLVAAGLPDDRKEAAGKMFLRAHGSLEPGFVVALRREFALQRRRILSHFPSP